MSGKDVITIKEYIDSRLGELDKRLGVHFESTATALKTANQALEARLEQLNEFRTQILEERAAYARKDEMEIRLNIIESKQSYGTGQTAGKEYAIGLFVAIGLGIAALLINVFA